MGESNRRVVLFGPALAGKTTIIGALGRLYHGTVEPIYPGSGEGAGDRGVRVRWTLEGVTYQVSTISGSFWDFNSWRALVSPENKVVLVIDSQPSMMDLSFEVLVQGYCLGLGAVAAVQLTKSDLKHSRIESLASTFRQNGIPTFLSRHDRPQTLVEATATALGLLVPG